MQSQNAQIFFRLLVNKYFPAKIEVLAKLLPKETYDALTKIPYSQKTPHVVLFNPDLWIHSCDASWFEPLLSTFPEPMKQLYLSILPKDVSESLRSISLGSTTLTPS